MKIIKLQSENFKKIKAIEITPLNNTVIISGRNGQGKTSVLDSIFVALCGKQKDLVKPIREGESESTITVELDKYYVTRIFKQGSTKLEVISKEGEIMASPQTLLDTIVGSLSFDPLKFSNLNDKEQRALLLKLTNCDLDTLDAQYKDLYERRREIGQDLTSFPEVSIHDIITAKEIVKTPPLNLSELTEKVMRAQTEHGHFVLAQAHISDCNKKLEEIARTIDELTQKRMGILAELAKAQTIKDTDFDINGAKQSITDAEKINQERAKAENILMNVTKREAIVDAYEKLSEELEKVKTQKETTLRNSKMPIEGLSISGDSVVYNQIPFSQLSQAEKLKVSMAIAMAMNPELRVIRILDGSLLDDNNMKVISEMAASGDFQVWVERVDSSGTVGFYVEEGEIKAVN